MVLRSSSGNSSVSAGPAAPQARLLAGRKHALDGLRIIAVAGVFFFHTATESMPGGSIGVDVFFTLSGFVITLLIMKERIATGRLHLGIFYAKRLARLWPALLALCAVIVTAGLLFPASGWGGQAGFVLPAAAYVMNLAHFGVFGDPIAGETLGPTWTLAVEEQFYLVWPLLLLGMLRFWKVRTAAIATVGLATAFVLNRFLLVNAGQPLDRIYNGPDTRADELLIGCALALLFTAVREGSSLHRALASAARWSAPLAGAALVAALFLLKEPDTPGAWFNTFWTVGPTALALVSAVLIGSLVLQPAGFLSRVFSHPWLARPGRDLSYAMYLWHLPVYLLLMRLIPALPLRIGLTAVLTVLLAYASFRWVERPLRLWANQKLEPVVVRSTVKPSKQPVSASAG
ncbi:acyltransferase family protein [Pseudarthrobacter niigatensis]|uniref:Peptidoglycan/LPS O-acetylase OafA/YrhL n=1 Tax=Pseudarthrobacter niigatensis TaxID=369935 RepID=A0AAJ1WFJ4_9MICC|nr:acyltransferase [Pseudarthrobacter niigatensis]MDQ0145930.1 peptidoglycan/LPS O-acetylase OafA/YrhL [Pseudarthrobacter niigatensis]MDQ0266342.1 peptidoglycan/LPS O-acetylase OafA/YrhL [Pseudarthrobacter niigatensis]